MNSSTRELEREVEASRANIEYTVQALRDRMSLGEMVDEASRYFRESGGADVVSRLGEQVRANPLPLALVGVGLAWLMSGRGQPHLPERGHSHAVYPPLPASTSGPSAAEAYRTHGAAGALYRENTDGETWEGDGEDSGGTLSDVAKSVRDRAGAAAAGIGAGVSAVGSAASSAADWASSGAHTTGEAGARAYERTGEASLQAYDRASGYAREAYGGAQRTFLDVLEREPLVIGAIGVAVGAAIGAMLPRTELEDRYMGEAASRVRSEAEGMVKEQVERGVAAADEAYEAAREEAKAQGLTPDRLVERAGVVAAAADEGAREALEKEEHG